MKRSFDLIGNIAVLKFPNGTKKSEKIRVAKQLISEHKNIKTVVEKSEKIKGRLRKFKTKHLFGEKTKEALHKENACWFKFNIDETYFSPRLSNERKEIAGQVRKGEKVLVMFSGVGPFPIIIAKFSKAKIIYSIEINRKASKYAKENIRMNRLDNVEHLQGDVKKIIPKLKKKKIIFDRVVMPRPQLKETFLKSALSIIKKGGIINYYGFGKFGQDIINEIEREAKKARKKIKILKIKKAGELAPYKYRWRVDLRTLN